MWFIWFIIIDIQMTKLPRVSVKYLLQFDDFSQYLISNYHHSFTFEFVPDIEPPKTSLYLSVWFPWLERLAGPSWRSKWSSSPILNPRYWPKKLRFASLPHSTPLVFNWSAWKEKPNIRSSSSHVFTNPESTNFHKILLILFFYKIEIKNVIITFYFEAEKDFRR